MNRLKGKVAVVTGASKGIGAAIAVAYGAEGAAVVVNYASSKEGAERVVAEITKNGGTAVALQADMSKPSEVKKLFAETKKRFGRLDILVNNAGIYEFGPLEAVTPEHFHRHFDINVLGPILAAQEAVNLFGEDGGSVINLSSIVSAEPHPYTLLYSASKSALDNATITLARELGPKKVRVNSIRAGVTETEGVSKAGVVESDMGKMMLAGTPLGRFGQPKDIAGVAVFLASPESQWITGESIRVSGGLR